MIRIEIGNGDWGEFPTYEEGIRYLVWMSRAQESGPLQGYGPVEPPRSGTVRGLKILERDFPTTITVAGMNATVEVHAGDTVVITAGAMNATVKVRP